MGTMKVAEIVAQYPPIFGDWVTWDDAVTQFYKDEPALMNELYSSYKRCGEFRNPVWIERYQDVDGEHAYVANGARRIAVALREGIEELPVEFANSSFDQGNYYETFIEVTNIASPDELQKFSESVDSQLRSWELNSSVWLTTEILEGRGLARLIIWSVQTDTVTSDEISQGVRDKLHLWLPELEFSVITRLVERN